MKTKNSLILIIIIIIIIFALGSCGQDINPKRKATSTSSSLKTTKVLPLAMGTIPTAISKATTTTANLATLTSDQKKLLYSNWSNRTTGLILILSALDPVAGNGSIYFSLIKSSSVKTCAANAAIAIDSRTNASQIYGNITINGGQAFFWSEKNLALKSDTDCSVISGRFDFIASASGFYVEDPSTSLANQTPLFDSSSSPDQLGPYFSKWYSSSTLILDLSGLSQIGAATHNFIGSDGSQCQSILAIGGREGSVMINILTGSDINGNITKACSVRDGAYRVQSVSANTLTIQGKSGPALAILPGAADLTNTIPTNTTLAVTWTTQEEAVWKTIQAKIAYDVIMNQANAYLSAENSKATTVMNGAISSQASVAPTTATASLKAIFAKYAAAETSMNTWKNITKGGNWSSTDQAHHELQAAVDSAYKDALNAVKALPGGLTGGSAATWSSLEEMAWKNIRARIAFDETMVKTYAYISAERSKADAASNAVMRSSTSVAPATATIALKNAIAKYAAAVSAMDTWRNITKGGNWSSTEQAHKDLQAAMDLSYSEAFALAKAR